MPYLQATKLLLSLGSFGLNLLNYLNGTQSNAPQSTGIQAPFTPQFTGGQSSGVRYTVAIKARYWGAPTGVNDWIYDYCGYTPVGTETYKNIRGIYNLFPDSQQILGSISKLEFDSNGRLVIFTSSFPNGKILGQNIGFGNQSPSFFVTNPQSFPQIIDIKITRFDGQTDTGGNPPNPNPSISNPDGGYQDGAPPVAAPVVVTDRSTDTDIVPAIPPALIPSALSGLLALLKAAASIAELAQRIADLIEGIYSLLKTILDFLRELQKLLPYKKSVVSIALGLIEKDGFLRLYPTDRSKLQAISLDVMFTSIPLWKKDTLLSLRSPNRYINLGRILFVSATMGVIEEIELNYTILSLPIPENAIGFYYHLGLDGISKAKTTTFYLRDDR